MPKCISSCYALTGPVISVEIKPKQGFLPSPQQLDNQLWIKAKVCRFALKQAYKVSG
jgi:inositol-pentakisphosphate 2-kinase, putative